MISIGGVIGVGMFLGSAATVRLAGPSVILAYALGAVIMMLVMSALAEMSIARPAEGSFRVYATEALGPYAGYLVGWTYWISWVVTMAAEVVAASTYMTWWFPHHIAIISGIIFAFLMTIVNLRNVRSFGTFEFWFAAIKVAAIILFILIGSAMIFGIGFEHPLGFINYTAYGGFFPRGIRGLLLAMAMVMIAYGGTEVIGVAAAETERPEINVPRAIKGIVLRTLILYIGAMAVLVGTIPWKEVGLSGSPFVLVYEALGIPAAPHIMNFVVITAAFSSMNCGLYTSSRMLLSLAESHYAPAFLSKINPRTGIPSYAVLISTASLYLGMLLYYLAPEQAFIYIASISAFGFLMTWLTISLSHIYIRPKIMRESPEALKFKAIGSPYTSWLAAILMLGVIITLWFLPEQRIGIYSGLTWLIFLSLYYLLSRKFTMRLPEHAPSKIKGLEFATFFGLADTLEGERAKEK